MQSETKIIDLGEATALVTVGFDLVRIEAGANGRHKIFVFRTEHPSRPEESIEDTIDTYQQRNLHVDAYAFYKSGREVKNKMYEYDTLHALPNQFSQ